MDSADSDLVISCSGYFSLLTIEINAANSGNLSVTKFMMLVALTNDDDPSYMMLTRSLFCLVLC
jgi:hypothetical protein